MNMLPVDKSIPDLLAEQARIKSRNRPIRDRSGQFIRPDAAIRAKLAADRMKARLEREVKAADHARGVVWEYGHYRSLPNADRLACVALPAALPLLERVAA
jgi:hypothetical protein